MIKSGQGTYTWALEIYSGRMISFKGTYTDPNGLIQKMDEQKEGCYNIDNIYNIDDIIQVRQTV